jgi:hypothetical protein
VSINKEYADLVEVDRNKFLQNIRGTGLFNKENINDNNENKTVIVSMQATRISLLLLLTVSHNSRADKCYKK